jgi:hypothetical protein
MRFCQLKFSGKLLETLSGMRSRGDALPAPSPRAWIDAHGRAEATNCGWVGEAGLALRYVGVLLVKGELPESHSENPV